MSENKYVRCPSSAHSKITLFAWGKIQLLNPCVHARCFLIEKCSNFQSLRNSFTIAFINRRCLGPICTRIRDFTAKNDSEIGCKTPGITMVTAIEIGHIIICSLSPSICLRGNNISSTLSCLATRIYCYWIMCFLFRVLHVCNLRSSRRHATPAVAIAANIQQPLPQP